MLPTLIAIPLFSVLVIFQSAIISRMTLLRGAADLILLVVIAWALQERVKNVWWWAVVAGLITAYVSALSGVVWLLSYLLVTGLALWIRRQIWQAPILAMLAVTFIGSLGVYLATGAYLRLVGTPLPILDTFSLIVLPSMILNLLLAVPVYVLVKDLAEWLYPEELEL
ncbi:MAG TPA: hypothetical protein EYP88_05165 [Anaerolineales bacterium]|nr:hypothetical protein [Anaerolineales bacterium]